MKTKGLIGWLSIFAQPKCGKSKLKLAKIRAKNIGVHLVDCHNNNNNMKYFFSFM
jgi:hypothetical protein